MSDGAVFHSESESIVEAAIRAALAIIGRSKEENVTQEQSVGGKPDSDSIVALLAREATRKINAIFVQLLSAVQRENQTLKAKVAELGCELKTVSESCENACLWRENVLNGCPVLFEQTNVIFSLKPSGMLVRKADERTPGDTESLAATGVTSRPDAGVDEATVEATPGPESPRATRRGRIPAKKDIAKHDSTTQASVPQNADGQKPQDAGVKKKASVFVCEVCDKSFNRQLHLKKHMNTHSEPAACSQCHRKFRNPATLERHLLRHEEKKMATFKCSHCEKTFRTAMLLKSHQVVHNSERPFMCSACGKAFKTKACLRAHQVVHSGEKPHKCNECGESFRYALTLRCHKSIHTGEYPFKCSVCNKAFIKRRSLMTHQAVHSGKTFTCETCGAGFTLQQNLKRHMRIHTGERPFRCKICGMSFVQNKLKAHMLLHGASKTFMCDLCGKTFLYNCQLQNHQKVAHGDADADPAEERRVIRKRNGAQGSRRVICRLDRTTVEVTPFSCKTCHRGFDSAAALKKHEQAHTGQMPFTCDTCGKSFRYKATFVYHQRVHSGERPFGCDVCGKRFIILQALKSHKLQHTGEKPHKCEQCGKAFRMYTNYRRHLRIHTGEKPYECEVCGAKFRQLGQARLHTQVHTGERPFTCAVCGLGFSDSRLLKRHNCREKYQKMSADMLVVFST